MSLVICGIEAESLSLCIDASSLNSGLVPQFSDAAASSASLYREYLKSGPVKGGDRRLGSEEPVRWLFGVLLMLL